MWRAAELGDLDMARVLIKKGCDPNEPTPHNYTSPLMFAAKGNHILMCMLLVKHGASLRHSDKNGKTAKDFATSEKVVEFLSSKEEPRQEPKKDPEEDDYEEDFEE